jgi:hypothetical protein
MQFQQVLAYNEHRTNKPTLSDKNDNKIALYFQYINSICHYAKYNYICVGIVSFHYNLKCKKRLKILKE